MSDPRSMRRMLLAAAAMAFMIITPIAGLRLYQTARVQALLDDYTHAPSSDAGVATTMISANTARLEIDRTVSPNALRAPIAVEMLAVHVSGAAVACTSKAVDLIIRYLQRDNSSREDFSHAVRVPAPAVPTPSVAYIPVYVFAHNPYIRFAGIEVPSEQRACVSGVSRLEDADRMRLLLETVVAERSPPVPLYQRLSDNIEIAPPHVRSAAIRLSRIW